MASLVRYLCGKEKSRNPIIDFVIKHAHKTYFYSLEQLHFQDSSRSICTNTSSLLSNLKTSSRYETVPNLIPHSVFHREMQQQFKAN